MTEKEFFDMYPRKLSDQQLEAVKRVDGQTLLLAVPGSGKTTVLIARLGYMMMYKGIDPSDMLTVTYTVAATKDMKKRFTDTFGDDAAQGLEFRTINGLCAKIMLEYGRMIGKEPYELQTDEGLLQKAVREILAENMDEYPGESDIKNARTLITYCKNMMLPPSEIDRLGEKKEVPYLRKVYDGYCQWLRSKRMMDYDDQMVFAYSILTRTPELLARYRKRFRYISVDEAQDTSKIQHELIRLLVGDDGNLFMVGDEDQSIYGFRAAYPEALLKFTEQHPSGKIIVMDRNFRSGKRIVELSDSVIKNNHMRHEKHMHSEGGTTGTVEFTALEQRADQYRRLMKEVQKEPGRLTALLCRENESLVPFVDILDRKGIPFALKGQDISFFTGKIVTDITGILGLAKDPDDRALFMKVYYKCKTYLKKYEAAAICTASERDGRSLKDSLRPAGLEERTVKSCEAFFGQLKKLLSDTPLKAISRIMNEIGYGAYLERIGTRGDRLFALKVIAGGEGTVNGFLARLKYLRELMSAGHGTGSEKLILSTVHSSKGLEYDRVFLADVCTGVFPPTGLEPEELEEERRLFYVGMTRAKEDLRIFTYADYPSVFADEVRNGARELRNADADKMAKAAVDIKPVPGMRVSQPKYGEGVITDVRPHGAEGQVTVRFASGEKTFVYPTAFAKGLKVIG